jgi:hypothetical protein
MLKNRKNLINVEIPRSQADYLKRLYEAKSHSSAVKQGIERLCQLDPEMLAAIEFDKANALAITKENQIRIMQATGYSDWRYAVLELISNYLQHHYNIQEQDNVQTND